MPRSPRVSYPGAVHHVMSRASDQRRLFADESDCRAFLDLMATARELYDVEWRMFVLMKTHFHAKVRVPHGNISDAMKYLLSKFAQQWNRRRRRRGPLLEGRFKAPLIEDGRYALTVVRYIALNPVKANYCDHPNGWRWTSHRALAGTEPPEEFLDMSWLRQMFDGPTLRDCQRQYQTYIDETEGDPIELVDTMFQGSPEFATDVRGLIGRTMHGIIVPRSYRALARPRLSSLFSGVRHDLGRRNSTIIRAQVVHGYTQAEIGRALGLHPNTISKITRQVRRTHLSLIHIR